MDTKQLEYIVAIAEEGNITKAAERMFISQPALSQQLISLEEEMNTQLFERKGRSLKPTKAGLIYLNGARSILNINKNLLNATPLRQNNRIVVCVSGAVPPTTILRVLNSLQKAIPDAVTEIKKMPCERALRELLKGYCDIVVTELIETVPEWPLTRLLIETQRLCLYHKTVVNRDSKQIPRLILSPPVASLRPLEDSLKDALGIKADLTCEVFDKTLTAEMISEGYAYGFLPEAFAEKYGLCTEENADFPEISFYAVYNPGILDIEKMVDIS